jgi:hypothetical protein
MKTSRIEKLFRWSAIWLASAIVTVAAGCTHGDASARKAAVMKTSAAPPPARQEKPVKLRYYGGPKYPRYPE